MPRLARLDAPGVLHHVIIRGIERRNIFEDNKDRDNLWKRLGELLPATKTSCYAWAMLSNHAHLLLRTGTTGLSIVMKRLLTGYVVSFNRRHLRPCQSSLTGQAWSPFSKSIQVDCLPGRGLSTGACPVYPSQSVTCRYCF